MNERYDAQYVLDEIKELFAEDIRDCFDGQGCWGLHCHVVVCGAEFSIKVSEISSS